jgi:branched-chain amino acid transport system substrate-binding protein
MQNDDYGKDYCEGFKEGLGKDAARSSSTSPTSDRSDGRQPGDPAQGLGRQRLLQHLDPEVRRPVDAQGGRLGWKPTIYLNNVSSSVASAMKPAGFENVQGVITAQYLMDPTDKQWDDMPT